MECKEACRLLLKALLCPPAARPDEDLARHLSVCAACAGYEDACQRVRDEVRALDAVAAPAELDELIADGIRRSLASQAPLKRPPASPAPELPGHRKALIVVAALVLLVALTAGLLAAFRGEHVPVPAVARVELLAGTVQVRLPGTSQWRTMGRHEFLPPGVEFRTERDSLLKLQTEGAQWWLPAVSALALGAPGEGELLFGRVYVQCSGTMPVKLVSEHGVAECERGAFTGTASMSRLRVGCVSGDVKVGEGQEQTPLQAGQCAVEAERHLSGPVREVRPVQLAYWLMEFEQYGQRRLSPRQIASVRLPGDAATLPPSVELEELRLTVVVRGPVAVVTATGTVQNVGGEPWQGALHIGDVLLPAPLAQAGSEALSVPPGRKGDFRTSALCLMPSRAGLSALGVSPSGWTRGAIGRLRLDVDAAAEGGLRSFDCPTLGERAKRPGVVRWSASRERADPKTPVVLEFEFHEPDGVDGVAFETPDGMHVLAGWRAEPPVDEWIRRGRNVFVAFDASADFGAGGRAYAQEVMESLLRFLPPGSSTALMAWDGTMKVDSAPLMRHTPDRAEAMLDALWRLGDGAKVQTAEFLRATVTLAAAAKGEGLLVFVAGRDSPQELTQAETAVRESGLRVAVLQVGADEPSSAYRALCARTGGVALALPDAVAPELAVADFLANLRSPGLAEVSLSLPAGAGGGVLGAEGGFAGQPVAALLELGPGVDDVQGSFRAKAGGRHLEREFTLHPKADVVQGGPLVGELVRKLKARMAR